MILGKCVLVAVHSVFLLTHMVLWRMAHHAGSTA